MCSRRLRDISIADDHVAQGQEHRRKDRAGRAAARRLGDDELAIVRPVPRSGKSDKARMPNEVAAEARQDPATPFAASWMLANQSMTRLADGAASPATMACGHRMVGASGARSPAAADQGIRRLTGVRPAALQAMNNTGPTQN